MPTQILYEPNALTEVLFDIVLPSKMQWHDLTFVRYPSVSLLSRQSLSPSVFALIGSSRHDTNFLYLPSPSIIHFDLRGFLPWEKGERGAQWNTHTACQSHQFLESLRKGDVGKRKKGRKEVFVFTTALKSPGQISKEFSLLSQKVFKYIFSMFLVELTVHVCHRWSCESYSQLLKAWIAILFSLHSSVWHCELFSSGGVFFFFFCPNWSVITGCSWNLSCWSKASSFSFCHLTYIILYIIYHLIFWPWRGNVIIMKSPLWIWFAWLLP